MVIRDIMSDKVYAMLPSDNIREAAKIMKKHDVGSVPVCDATGLLGIVTDRDLVLYCVADDKNVDHTTVSEVMTPEIVTASPNQDAVDALEIMADYQIRRMPVIEDGQVIGMVAFSDIAKALPFDEEIADTFSEISTNKKRK